MRRVVVSDDLSEVEIRPPDLLEEYFSLSRNEAPGFFPPAERVAVDCPFCGESGRTFAFSLWSFEYQECASCGSLYVSPRPTAERLAEFRARSESAEFWRSVLRQTARQRDERVSLPRLAWVANWVAERFREPIAYADWGSGSLAYLKEATRARPFSSLSAFEPDPSLAEDCEREGWAATAGGAASSFGALTAFDAVNRLFAPGVLPSAASTILQEGGFLFLTGRAAGFELQVLWGSAPSLHPLDHLNLPSIEGLTQLASLHGFEPVELSTPGQLDLPIVAGALAREPALPLPRWLRYLITKRGVGDHAAFQEFLQRARLSSHFRLAAQKVAKDRRSGKR